MESLMADDLVASKQEGLAKALDAGRHERGRK
jgi:hypothetical protein